MATQPEVAVVGAGIVGTILALGLLKQKIPVRVYEQSSGFREIGAGIGVTAVAEACSKCPEAI
jgi:salicylate hydroxylase